MKAAASCSKVWGRLVELGLGRGSSKGCRRPKFCAAVPAGRNSRLRRVDWPIKKTMQFFALSSRAVSKPVGENTSEFPPGWLRFSGLSRSQNRGNRSDRLISLEGGVQLGRPWCGKVRYGVGGRNWGNFNWENLPRKAILWRYCGAGISRARPLLV